MIVTWFPSKGNSKDVAGWLTLLLLTCFCLTLTTLIQGTSRNPSLRGELIISNQ
jgi:hypothetical protein